MISPGRTDGSALLSAEFTNALCQEKWLMEGGKLSVTGQSESAGNVKLEWKPEEETTDAFGEHHLPRNICPLVSYMLYFYLGRPLVSPLA